MNADVLLHWLLRTSLEASVLILAVLGLRLMLGTRLNPAWRIGLWMLVGAKLMLPAFIPAGFGLGVWFQRDEAAHVSNTPAAQVVVPTDLVRAADSGSSPILSESTDRVSASAGSFSRYTLALCVWLVGAVFVLAAALYRQWHFNGALRLRPAATDPLLRALVASLGQKAGIRKPVRVLLMPAGTTPAVVGMIRPSVLLPEDWETRFDERSLRHVLLHELLHVKQHDLLWNWAATAVQALHWFNPLVWFVVSRFQADRELRCDAGALALLSPTERLDYGHTLLRIQESFFAAPTLAGLAPCVRNHPTLRQRIHMIAHPTARQPVVQMMLVATLSVLVGYSFTTARAVEKEVPAKERTREGNRSRAEQPKSDESETGTPARVREGDEGAKKSDTRDGEGTRKAMARGSDGVPLNKTLTNRIVAIVDGEPIASSEVRKAMQADGGKHTEEEMLEIMIQEKIAKIQRTHPAKQPGVTRYHNDGVPSEADAPARPREGDGDVKKSGMRDGDGSRKPGMRDGEKPRRGAQDGEGGKKSGARDGDKAVDSGETITLKVVKKGEAVMVGDEEVAMNRLRGYLSTFLPDHPGAKVVITSQVDVPFSAILNTLDAVRDNGNKNAGIKAE